MEASRYELIISKFGFMAYDHDCDQFLYNDKNEWLFENQQIANRLIEDAVEINTKEAV